MILTADCGHKLVLKMRGEVIQKATLSVAPHLEYSAIDALYNGSTWRCDCLELWRALFTPYYQDDVRQYLFKYMPAGTRLETLEAHISKKYARNQRRVELPTPSYFAQWLRERARKAVPEDCLRIADMSKYAVRATLPHTGSPPTTLFIDTAKTAALYLPIRKKLNKMPCFFAMTVLNGLLLMRTRVVHRSTPIFEIGSVTRTLVPQIPQIHTETYLVRAEMWRAREWIKHIMNGERTADDWPVYFAGCITNTWAC